MSWTWTKYHLPQRNHSKIQFESFKLELLTNIDIESIESMELLLLAKNICVKTWEASQSTDIDKWLHEVVDNTSETDESIK